MALTLPRPGTRNGHVGSPHGAAGLVMLADPHAPAAEAYRTLGVNVQFSGVDRQVQAIAVTSPGPGEGKTTTAANLAIALAEGGNRVVVVDADLRRPSLHLAFGLNNEVGLTNAVLREGGALPLQDAPVPRVRVLASGPLPPNPVEVLGSRRFERVIAQLREEADYVVFDTPPAAALSDPAVLATRLDGVLLVIGAGRTRRDLARRARAQLERVGAHILGVVLTGVRGSHALHHY